MYSPSKNKNNIPGFSWIKSPKFTVYKNVVALSSAFFLLFASFQAISTLQTSINATKGLGSISLSVIYAFFIASCIFLPELLITYLSIKWTLFWCIIMYSTYIAANFKPTWFSLIPTSALLGLAAGPLWTSQSVYITALGKKLSRISSQKATTNSSPRSSPYEDRRLQNGVNYDATRNLNSPTSKRPGSPDYSIASVAEPNNSTALVPFLFGIFFAFFQTGTICGQLISSLTLRSDINPAVINKTSTLQQSRSINPNSSHVCGIAFCSNKVTAESNNLFKPSPAKLYTLYSIYTVLALLAALVIALFLDNVNTRESDESSSAHLEENEKPSRVSKSDDQTLEYDQFTNNIATPGNDGTVGKPDKTFSAIDEKLPPLKRTHSINDMCFATLNQMRRWQQLCLIPLSIYSGLQQGFMAADFTKAYVACNYGVWYLGYVMTVYASVNACISPVSGLISKKVPRWIIFLVSGLIHALGVFPILTFGSRAISQHFYLMFVGAALFGVFDGVWQPQINGLYSTLFQDNPEPAFANHRLWESIGFIISFSYHDILCLRSKLFFLAFFLALGSITYTILEVRLKRQQKQLTSINP